MVVNPTERVVAEESTAFLTEITIGFKHQGRLLARNDGVSGQKQRCFPRETAVQESKTAVVLVINNGVSYIK